MRRELIYVFLHIILQNNIVGADEISDEDILRYALEKEYEYRPIEIVTGKQSGNYKTFQKSFECKHLKMEREIKLNEMQYLEDKEMELEDVEYREKVAKMEGKDPRKIWKSTQLEEFLKQYPYVHVYRSRRKRLATANADKYWQNGIIPYTWTDYQGDDAIRKRGVTRAFSHIEYWTCIRFVEWTNHTRAEYELNHDSKLLMKRAGGCNSLVGKTDNPDGQGINCCEDRFCVHELLHAMGLYHEQKNPLRKDFISVLHDNMDIEASKLSNFRPLSPQLVNTFGRYDLSSIMHYGTQAYHNNFQDTIRVLDPDKELVLLNGDPIDFYAFQELSEISNCSVKCSDLMKCHNFGYPTSTRGRCFCRCIDGLDPFNECFSLYYSDLEPTLNWPGKEGFTLLKPKLGCPQGFVEGNIRFTTLISKDSLIDGAEIETDNENWNKSFCTRKSVTRNEGIQWGPGKYCIFQHGDQCPPGFDKGSVKIDTVSKPTVEGFQPDGDYSNDVVWNFCCRNDARLSQQLNLPNKEPFILFQKTYLGCQEVAGMQSTVEYFKIKNVDDDVAYRYGSYPRVKKFYRQFRFFYCYYTPNSYDPTKRYSRWPEDAVSMIKSIDGCPRGFTESSVIQNIETLAFSFPLYSDISVENNELKMKFCSKPHSYLLGMGSQWPPGSYCVLNYGGSCPLGFEDGYVRLDGLSKPETLNNDYLPDGNFSTEIQMHFCCRDDGMWSDPITLPTEDSFVLFNLNKFPCQKVVDMVDKEDYVQVKNGGDNEQDVYGFVPKISMASRKSQIHFCHYLKPKTVCGGIYELTDIDKTIEVTSPNHPGPYPARYKCYYIIKSPPNTKLILNFLHFDIHASEGGDCLSYVGIRNDLPGQPEIRYCGDRFEQTVVTFQNFLGLSFLGDNNEHSHNGFRATVSVLKEDDLCYTGNGTTYNGEVNVTRKFQPCLPWHKVTHCTRHLYGKSDSYSFLKENYCRQAGGGIAPWCYTDDEECHRDYCDVCNIERCYDVFLDCTNLIKENPSYCHTDIEAERGCRKSCGLCKTDRPLSVSEVTCKPPTIPDDATPTSPLKTSYKVGDAVGFRCKSGFEIDIHVCLSDGSWSGGNFVCGHCTTGWISYKGSCYKWIDVHMTFGEGKQLCAFYHSTLASAKTPDENEFLLSLRDNGRSFWLGMERNNTDIHTWIDDNSLLTWTNWATDGDRTYPCANIQEDGKWNGWGCEWDFFSVICKFTPNGRFYVAKQKFTPNERTSCVDYRPDCDELIRNDPTMCVALGDYAQNNCPWSCGFCGEVSACATPPRPPYAIQIQGGSVQARVGRYFAYTCFDGYGLDDGDEKRACLRDGTLTGKAPVCKEASLVSSRNNDVSLLPRDNLGIERKTYIGINLSMRVHRTGLVTGWLFYSMVNCEVTFSVWRQVSSNLFMLVGRNTIENTLHGRKRNVTVPYSEQYMVQEGDIIGVFFTYGKGVCVPYDLCKLKLDHFGGQMISLGSKGKVDAWTVNQIYEFKQENSPEDCKVWSFSAIIQ